MVITLYESVIVHIVITVDIFIIKNAQENHEIAVIVLKNDNVTLLDYVILS